MMNRFLRSFAFVSLSSLLAVSVVQASDNPGQSPQTMASANFPGRANTPDNGAIRRANPNSRQGTESISPLPPGPNLRPAQPRPPTLENGGIGNGYPTRQISPRPSSGNERRSN